jgi:DinB superfamily
MENQDLAVKIVVDGWHTALSRTDALINSFTDEQIAGEVAPGRNSGTYLLGHLTAVHDRMLPLLGLGTQLHPELDEVFLTSPDKSGKPKPSIPELRAYWKEVNEAVAAGFATLKPEEWLHKHTSVSEEDFAKEPHRNRLNVLVSRTNHLSSHYGQLLFLKK